MFPGDHVFTGYAITYDVVFSSPAIARAMVLFVQPGCQKWGTDSISERISVASSKVAGRIILMTVARTSGHEVGCDTGDNYMGLS